MNNNSRTKTRIKRVAASFFQSCNVMEIARELIGKVLVTEIDGSKTSGMIVETEAYAGESDKASHAFGGRRTARTAPMYGPGGMAYVYFCYGMHHLFNVVTHSEGIPHAVLIRAIAPLEGIEIMLARRKKIVQDNRLTSGPGSVACALGIHTGHTGISLTGRTIWMEDHGIRFDEGAIGTSPRIGVNYAGADALLPYRFYLRSHPCVSGIKSLRT